MSRHISRDRERGVSLLVMAFTLALLMGWMSLHLIAVQQESLYMAAMERKNVVDYWEMARYQHCVAEEGEASICTYLLPE